MLRKCQVSFQNFPYRIWGRENLDGNHWGWEFRLNSNFQISTSHLGIPPSATRYRASHSTVYAASGMAFILETHCTVINSSPSQGNFASVPKGYGRRTMIRLTPWHILMVVAAASIERRNDCNGAVLSRLCTSEFLSSTWLDVLR